MFPNPHLIWCKARDFASQCLAHSRHSSTCSLKYYELTSHMKITDRTRVTTVKRLLEIYYVPVFWTSHLNWNPELFISKNVLWQAEGPPHRDFCHIAGSHRCLRPSSQPVTMIGRARPVRTEIKSLKTNTRVDKEHLRILVGTSDAKIWCLLLLILALQKFLPWTQPWRRVSASIDKIIVTVAKWGLKIVIKLSYRKTFYFLHIGVCRLKFIPATVFRSII